jgi:hypothetical protein
MISIKMNNAGETFLAETHGQNFGTCLVGLCFALNFASECIDSAVQFEQDLYIPLTIHR